MLDSAFVLDSALCTCSVGFHRVGFHCVLVFRSVGSHCVVYLYCVLCAFVGVVFNIVLVMCQLSCCCSGLSCLYVVLWCVGVVRFAFCVVHNHLCLIQPLCQIQPLCAFQSSGRNNGW